MVRLALEEIAEPVDPIADPAVAAHQRLLGDAVRKAVAGLDPKLQALLYLRFGLGGSNSCTLSETARILRRDQHWVR
jgi:hypothetical protein